MAGTTVICGLTSGIIQDLNITTGLIANEAVTAAKFAQGAVGLARIRQKIITLVALADAAANPTAAQLVGSSYFTQTPTAGRAFNVPAAVDIVAEFADPQVGTWFKFYLVVLAAFALTVTAGAAGITLVGVAATFAVNNTSEAYLGVLTNVTPAAEAVSIVRL